MACLGCSCGTDKGKESDNAAAGGVKGCASGGCASGGCNRHNTYDWITAAGIRDIEPFDVVEVSFKNGSRKEFFKNPAHTRVTTGDDVLVESAAGGYDIGKVSLSGELVRLQMKRKRVREDARFQAVVRKAHERDLERLDEVRKMEKEVMIRSRVISRTLDLNMKICDIEFQGDGRKCTFYYTADGRVDFRELIRHYAKEFKVKIEMRQIGARQESARIGGLGNCGRELCCSTWLHEFKSVNTAAARYQNLAINQTKLSGMCGRLKCCLNYEVDAYIDALEDFPERAERVKTQAGLAVLVKTDVFKRLMFYTYAENRHKFYALSTDQVWEALANLKEGIVPVSLEDILARAVVVDEEEEEFVDFENVHDVIQLPFEKRKKKKKKKGREGFETAASAIEKQPLGSAAKPQDRRRENRDNRGGGNRPNSQGKLDRPTNRNADSTPPKWEDRKVRPTPEGEAKKPQNRPEGEGNKQQNRPPRPERSENPNQKPRSENPNQKPRSENPNQKPRTENPNQNRPPRSENPNHQPRSENPNQQQRPKAEFKPRVDENNGDNNNVQNDANSPQTPNGENKKKRYFDKRKNKPNKEG
jgi:cell fate regulator YaaT (PSP1 superfamily)